MLIELLLTPFIVIAEGILFILPDLPFLDVPDFVTTAADVVFGYIGQVTAMLAFILGQPFYVFIITVFIGIFIAEPVWRLTLRVFDIIVNRDFS